MVNLEKIQIDKLPFKIIKKGDLINYEGPILSHFTSEEDNDYLMYWVDYDDDSNRWMLFYATKLEISEYINKKSSLLEILHNSASSIYFLDYDQNVKIKELYEATLSDIPPSYLPPKDSYYDYNIETDYSKNLLSKFDTIAINKKIAKRNRDKALRPKNLYKLHSRKSHQTFRDYLKSLQILRDKDFKYSHEIVFEVGNRDWLYSNVKLNEAIIYFVENNHHVFGCNYKFSKGYLSKPNKIENKESTEKFAE